MCSRPYAGKLSLESQGLAEKLSECVCRCETQWAHVFANNVSRRCVCMMGLTNGTTTSYTYTRYTWSLLHNQSKMAAHNFHVPAGVGRPYTKYTFHKVGRKIWADFCSSFKLLIPKSIAHRVQQQRYHEASANYPVSHLGLHTNLLLLSLGPK